MVFPEKDNKWLEVETLRRKYLNLTKDNNNSQ